MNSHVAVSDDPNIQITISPDQSHEQTAAPQDKNRGVNQTSTTELLDDCNIQITISPDHIPDQSHEQTPNTTLAATSLQDENIGVNEITSAATSVAASMQDEGETPEDLNDRNIQITISPDHIPDQSHEQTPNATLAATSPQDENIGVNEITSAATSVAASVQDEDDRNIQITISPDHIPDQSHEQSPNATLAATSPQDENIGVNEITSAATSVAASLQAEGETAEDLSQNIPASVMMDELHRFALFDMWLDAQHILDEYSDLIRTPLNGSGDTVLHVAVSARSTTFMEELVKLMSPEDMLIPNKDGMLPVHLAALTGQNEIVQELSLQNLLYKMDHKDIERLFFMTISSNMFNVAKKLFQEYPTVLAIARDEERLTALHKLAQKPSEFLNMKGDDNKGAGLELLEIIWDEVKNLKFQRILELITEPSAVLFDAVKSGNIDVVQSLTYDNPKLVTIKDPKSGYNLLHFAIRYRQSASIFRFMLNWPETEPILLRAVDNEGNNVLHLAAHLPLKFEAVSSCRASIQMQRELTWFKDVERRVPDELSTMRNKKGKTPIAVFYDEHKKLSEEIKGAAKGIAESSMLVAVLVATVAFAAVLTAPGDKTNAWFIVFILTNAVALFSSSASLISFLSNYTSSRFAESEFVKSPHPSLTFGPALLLVSVIAMIMAFIAASFLIFDHTSKWVAYAVASMAVYPILLIGELRFSYFEDFLWARYHRLFKLR